MSPSNAESQLHRTQRLLESLPAGVYTCDAEGLIVGYNAVAVQLWGREPALNDPVDRYCGSFKLFDLHGTPIAHDQCWMALALQHDRSYNGEKILIERPDGTRRVALAHANPLRDDAQNVVGALNILIDVTEQSRASDTQRLLAAIVESSQDAIVSKDLDGRILSWNSGAERLFGYSSQEAIGQSITMIIPPERRHEEATILQRLRNGERIEHFDTERIAKSGDRVIISLTVSPIRDETGRVVAASKVARDITAQREAQLALVQLKDELGVQIADLQRLHEMSLRLASTHDLQRILKDVLATAMAVAGADCGLLSLLEADSNCLEVGASMGFSDESLELIRALPNGVGPCGACLTEGRRVIVADAQSDPLFAEHRDLPQRLDFRAVHSIPLNTRHGKTLGVLTMQFRTPHRPSDREVRLTDLCARHAVDFIENAQLYQALRDADQRKDEFLAVLAHELRNPMAPISNALQVLRLSDDLTPASLRMCEIMQRQVTHLARMVDDLLDVSRITRGKVELRREPVDLVSAISAAVETSKPFIELKGHQLSISLSPEPIVVEADSVRLSQVIANLLNNSCKYTDRGGQIWLTAQRKESEAMISVRDTGVGIAPETLPRVFDLFSQADRTIQRSHGGLGIGLHLAKNLVQLHGGTIEARSAGLGQGSEFVIRLPLSSSGQLPARLPSPTTAAPLLPPRRILVVDDTRAAAYMLGKLLEALGQNVQVVHDGESALERVRSYAPDVVFSDIAMPKMDGFELARHVRQSGFSQPVLVALTGFSQESDRDRTRSAGYDYHLVKPVGLEMLQQLLGSLPRAAPARADD
jgi:PAS domain S-box-containing protein